MVEYDQFKCLGLEERASFLKRTCCMYRYRPATQQALNQSQHAGIIIDDEDAFHTRRNRLHWYSPLAPSNEEPDYNYATSKRERRYAMRERTIARYDVVKVGLYCSLDGPILVAKTEVDHVFQGSE